MMVQTWNPQNIIHDIFNHCCLEYYNIHVMKFIQEAHKREKMTFYIWNKRVWIFCCLIIVSLHMVGFFEQVFWSKTLIFCCVTFQKLLWNIARKEMNGVTSYPSHYVHIIKTTVIISNGPEKIILSMSRGTDSIKTWKYYRHRWWLLCMLRCGKLNCIMTVTKTYYEYGHLYLSY